MFEFFIYMLTMSITPGPNTITSMANAAEKGIKGVTLNLGMFIGITFVALSSFFLISILSKYIPALTMLLQILGILYLLYLALKMLRKNSLSNEKTGTFLDGLLMQVMNVKVLMLCVTAISEYIIPLSLTIWEGLVRVSLIPLTCFLSGLVWAVAGSAMKKLYEKKRKYLNLFFSTALFILAFVNFLKLLY